MTRTGLVLSTILLGTSALAWNPRYPLPHVPCAFFPADNVWNADISALPVDAHSDDYVASIGASTGLHPDFGTRRIGIPYAVADPGQTPVTIQFTAYGDESDRARIPCRRPRLSSAAAIVTCWSRRPEAAASTSSSLRIAGSAAPSGSPPAARSGTSGRTIFAWPT